VAVVVTAGLFAEGLQQLEVPQHTVPTGQNPPVVGQHTEPRG